jgi:hypothetical protein
LMKVVTQNIFLLFFVKFALLNVCQKGVSKVQTSQMFYNICDKM